MPGLPASNADLAARLDRVADLLEAQDADRYRVAADRRAAATIRAHPRPLAEIHESLGIETLEDLEAAAHDGRLETVSGFGARRVRAVREQLSTILSRASRLRSQRSPFAERRHAASVPRLDVESGWAFASSR